MSQALLSAPPANQLQLLDVEHCQGHFPRRSRPRTILRVTVRPLTKEAARDRRRVRDGWGRENRCSPAL